jgi:hypothetical protein
VLAGITGRISYDKGAIESVTRITISDEWWNGVEFDHVPTLSDEPV